jgi:hypothetical protein
MSERQAAEAADQVAAEVIAESSVTPEGNPAA